MKSWRESQTLRRVCFSVATLAPCVAVLVGIVVPIRAFFVERDARIAKRTTLLARLQSIAAQENNIRSIAQKLDAERGEFLVGPNDSVLNADLQTQLKSMAETAGARVRSLQGLPAVTGEYIRYSGARVEISGPIQSIHRAIYAIESARPYLFVTGATMTSSPPVGGRREHAEEPAIQARLDVFGATQIEGRTP